MYHVTGRYFLADQVLSFDLVFVEDVFDQDAQPAHRQVLTAAVHEHRACNTALRDVFAQQLIAESDLKLYQMMTSDDCQQALTNDSRKARASLQFLQPHAELVSKA